MQKFVDNLPKPTKEQTDKKEELCNCSKPQDNFTVKKCPLMDNFENMESSMFSKELTGCAIQNTTEKNGSILLQRDVLHANGSLIALTDIKDDKSGAGKSKFLPTLHGIKENKVGSADDNDDVDANKINEYVPNVMTSIYVGSLTVVGLFVLFRVIKK